MRVKLAILFLTLYTIGFSQVTVIENQNVGVGTDMPTEQLEVDGNFVVDGNANIQNSRSTTILNGTVDNDVNSAFNSIYIGKNSGQNQSSQSNYNVGVGGNSLKNSTGRYNIAVGFNAMYKSTTGNDNISIGGWSGPAGDSVITTLNSCTYIGPSAGYYNTEDNRLFISGKGKHGDPLIYGEFDNKVLKINGLLEISQANIINTRNTTLLNSNNIEASNSAFNSIYIGKDSGANQNSVSNYNVGIGGGSLRNSTGKYNIAVGFNALYKSTTGDDNISIGRWSGPAGDSIITTLSNCTYIGPSAGYYNTEDNRLFISGKDLHSRPLIYGEFDDRTLKVGGVLEVRAYDNIGAILALQPRLEPDAAIAEEGMIYFNNTDKKVYVYSGGQWKALKFE